MCSEALLDTPLSDKARLKALCSDIRVTAISPGLASPTIVPEASSEWVAVHSVVDRDSVWDLLPRLQAVGARDILVMRIEQMVS